MQISLEDRAFTVLVIDDDPPFRRVLRQALESSGFFRVIDEAANGEEALRLAAKLAPDVILLDLAMPGPGGVGVLPGLRAIAPSSLVAVVSGPAPAMLGASVWRSGADLHLEKTSRLNEIVGELLTEIQVRKVFSAAR